MLFYYDQTVAVHVEGSCTREKKPGAPEEGGGSLFELGQVVGTPGALQALTDAGQQPAEFLARHVTGDWGDLCDEDKEENELSE